MADWTEKEVDIILDDYFSMLTDELHGKSINKTTNRNKLLQALKGRTKGSVEYKHQNISAALFKLNQPWIDGYKPAFNYQNLLDSKVADYLTSHPGVLTLFKDVATEPVSAPKIDFDNFEAPKPEKVDELKSNRVEDSGPRIRKAVKLDYFEIERANRSLGSTGEELVVKFEKWRLTKARKESLIKKIEWVSKDQGDGLGFDILSRNIDGTERYIEVKTTKQGKNTPIFFSRNEYEFANENHKRFYLYRVYDFKKTPKMFMASGRFEEFCSIRPEKFRGLF
jgi:hypothetical protein